MRWLLIVNPYATGVDEARVAAVQAELPEGLETRLTSRAGEATELARAAEGEVDAIVVLAGDGTYNEVLNGVAGRTPLGFLPGGGTSVLPRALGLPRDPVAAARRLRTATPRRISLGVVNGRRFGFSSGIGLDAELVRRVDAYGRRPDGCRPGDSAFARAALAALAARRGRLDPVLEVEGLGRAAAVLVSNCDSYSYLGARPLHVAPLARFEAGLDVTAPTHARLRTWPRLARYVLLGTPPARRRDVLSGHDLDALRVRCDVPLPLQADGEDLGDVTEAAFACERGAVTVLA